MIDFISLYLHIVNIIRYHYFTIKYVESTSIKLKKFDKKIALYQGIERKYFNSTVKLPSLFDFHENSWPQLKIPELIACIPTLFVGYYSKDLMKIVLTGIISIAVIRLFL